MSDLQREASSGRPKDLRPLFGPFWSAREAERGKERQKEAERRPCVAHKGRPAAHSLRRFGPTVQHWSSIEAAQQHSSTRAQKAERRKGKAARARSAAPTLEQLWARFGLAVPDSTLCTRTDHSPPQTDRSGLLLVRWMVTDGR